MPRRRKLPPPDPRTDPGGWNEAQTRPRTIGSIALALSGGGHRATLFALGGITAVVDAGLWPAVRWISSVSGGSFANAIAARKLPDNPTAHDMDRVLRRATENVTSRFGLLRSPRPAWSRASGGLVGACYESGINALWSSEPARPAWKLADLRSATRSHVFLAVDLVTLQPVLLSDRVVFAPALDDERDGLHDPGPLWLSRAVRGSAAFPLTPAARITRSELGQGVEPLRRDLLLADGGLRNNLATHGLEMATRLMKRCGEHDLDFAGLTDKVDLTLVMDASAPPRRSEWKARCRWWDRPLATGWRSFEASQQSTVDAYRSIARTGSSPIRLVDIGQTPRQVQPRGVLVGGAPEADWVAVRDHNVAVGTIAPTAHRISAQTAIHLMAHGYAGAAAHLTDLGEPFSSFSVPHERIRGALA